MCLIKVSKWLGDKWLLNTEHSNTVALTFCLVLYALPSVNMTAHKMYIFRLLIFDFIHTNRHSFSLHKIDN